MLSLRSIRRSAEMRLPRQLLRYTPDHFETKSLRMMPTEGLDETRPHPASAKLIKR